MNSKTIFYNANTYKLSKIQLLEEADGLDKLLQDELGEEGPILEFRSTKSKSTFAILDTADKKRVNHITAFLVDNGLQILEKNELYTYIIKPINLQLHQFTRQLSHFFKILR